MDVRKLLFVVLMLLGTCGTAVWAQSSDDSLPMPFWIWSPEHTQNRVPLESCYFRKEVFLPTVRGGEFDIAADDEFELFINGKSAGTGSSWEKFTTLDVGGHLKPGKNVIAIKVTNLNGSTAGVAARLRVDSGQEAPRVYLTNPTWRTSVNVLPLWNRPRYRDSRWGAAQNFGAYGEAAPWITDDFKDASPVQSSEQLALNKPGNSAGTSAKNPPVKKRAFATDATREPFQNAPSNEQKTPTDEGTETLVDSAKRRINLPQFDVTPGFRIEHVMGGDETGSLISATFNEFGQILAGREGGPLLMLYDTNENGVPDAVRVCCDELENCQGIVCVSGRIFVTADGPEGLALYRLEDKNHDGNYETIGAIVKFEGKASEHGPHGVAIGPDGMLYVMVGNYTKLTSEVASTSPYKHVYEGDLLPRYDDPQGHAKGITAPGGAVIRCRQDGSNLEMFAGGLRNCYDLTFHPSGDLFTHDSDMETDEGTPWHRSTRFLHVPSGAELGWRSGWAKWPEYWIDVVPASATTGRGSPTGLVAYEHTSFPAEFRDVIFSCDWAQGQVNAIRIRVTGAGYAAESEPFLRGKPLNVTDVMVGPDGWLYFVTGGRGTAGHVFRVVWEGTDRKGEELVPAEPTSIADAVQFPQFSSAWSRQSISVARQAMGSRWDQEIRQFVEDTRNHGRLRARALEMMHLVGPPPTDQLLVKLGEDADAAVRARAAYYLGLIGNPPAVEQLTKMLADKQPVVRRVACEALARKSNPIGWEDLAPLLRSGDRIECWVARRLLEQNGTEDWLGRALAEQTPSGFLQGATAWLIARPDASGAQKILQRVGEFAAGFVNDADFVDMLRVMELAILRGELEPEEVQSVAAWLAPEFPAGNPLITRELATLITYTQMEGVTGRMLEYLRSDVAQEEKLHTATRLRFLTRDWTSDQKMDLILFLESARAFDGGSNLAKYVEAVQLDFVNSLNAADHQALIAQGEKVPQAALATLFSLPEKPDDATIDALVDLYARVPVSADEAFRKLRVGIIAVLGTHAGEKSMAYLRAIYDTDPERRQEVAMALAQQPDGRNWDYLVRSIATMEGDPAREVFQKLQTVPYAPESAEYFRQLIIAGLRLDEDLAREADALLTHWTQRPAASPDRPIPARFADWQAWFSAKYPDQQPAALAQESSHSTWTVDDLVTYLESAEGQAGSMEHGASVYRKAQCASCHRFGQEGQSIGPDLSTVVYRFQRKEILEAIVHPSQTVPDQYASHTIGMKDGRTLTGLLMPSETGKVIVVQPDGKTTKVNELDIDEVHPSQVSSMPEGLFDELTLEEIRDLFAYLNSAKPPEFANGATAVRR